MQQTVGNPLGEVHISHMEQCLSSTCEALFKPSTVKSYPHLPKAAIAAAAAATTANDPFFLFVEQECQAGRLESPY